MPNGSSLRAANALAAAQRIATHETGQAEFDAFNGWVSRYLAAPETERGAMLAEGIAFAEARRLALTGLIPADPRRAIENAVPPVVRQELPMDVVKLLEERVNEKAFYGVLGVVPSAENPATPAYQREVRTSDGGRYRAFVYGDRLSLPTTENASIVGIAVDDAIAINERPLRVVGSGEIPNHPNNLTRRRTVSLIDEQGFSNGREVQSAPAAPHEVVETCPVSGDATEKSAESAAVTETEIVVEAGGQFHFLCSGGHIQGFQEQLTALEGGNGGPVMPTSPPSATQATGYKTHLLMRIAFPEALKGIMTEKEGHDYAKGVQDWFIDNSYGAMTFMTTVTPLIIMPRSEAWYTDQATNADEVLFDARVAAKAAGYDPANFNFDTVIYTGPGNFGGKAYVGGKGCWMRTTSVGVACHEYGHNFGLWHANFWETTNGSAIGGGTHKEYWDSFDTMGSANAGDYHFNAYQKNLLNWMPTALVNDVTTSGTYRIYQMDQPAQNPRLRYAIKTRKDADRDYWVDFRQLFTSNAWVQGGVFLHWSPWTASGSGSHLLDTTPGSPDARTDAPLVIGRTFSDPETGIHITPISKNATTPPSADVVVNLGTFPGNTAPVVAVSASATSVATNAAINFTATASDPEGDVLSYAWEFGDNSFSTTNSAAVSKSWATAGVYRVRCTVSDMKGQTASSSVIITVGSATTYTVAGTITVGGLPMQGVRVHNGRTGTGLREDYTGADGTYTIVGLAAGTYSVSPQLYGYTISPTSTSVTVGSSKTGVNFTATDLALVSIALQDADCAEGANTGSFRITRTGSTSAALTVLCYAPSGSATKGTDYTLSPDTVAVSPFQSFTIPSGQAFLDVVLTASTDAATESFEMARLELVPSANYLLGAAAATLVIADANTTNPLVRLSVSDRDAEESGDPGQFVIERVGSTASSLTVNYTVTGTATNGSDYSTIPTSVVIPAGASTAAVNVNPLQDTTVETMETVILTISTNATYVRAASSTDYSGTVNLHDDDAPTLTVVATDATASEPGLDTGEFTITRTGSTSQALTVNYGLTGSALHGTDYVALPGVLTIPAGSSSSTVLITPINDDIGEPAQTVLFQLRSGLGYAVSSTGNATVTITDDGDLPYASIAVTAGPAVEGGAAGTFRITTTGTGSGNITVRYTVSGTATNGTDYTLLSGTVSMAKNATANISIAPIQDTAIEGYETVTVTLTPDPAYSLALDTSAMMNLQDDDAPQVNVSGTDDAFSEANGSLAKFFISRTGATTNALTVNYTMGGTATSGTDYTAPSGSVTIAAGATGAYVNISMLADTLAEGTERIILNVTPGGSYAAGIGSATRYITDAQSASVATQVRFSAASSSAAENVGTVNIPVTLSAAAAGTVTVEYFINGGTALGGGADYRLAAGVLTFAPGETAKNIPVDVLTDTITEGNETLVIALSNPGNARLGTSSHTLTITNVDVTSPNTVVVGSPNGGETIYFGSTQTITWSANITGNVKIELFKAGFLHSVLSADEANDNSYLWSVSAGLPSGADYTVKVSSVDNPAFSDLSNAAFSITANPLPAAVDAPDLPWSTSGDSPWFAETTTTHDGIDAVQSGAINHLQSSSLETSITGAGTLTFWWKVSSESGYDFLSVYLNGVLQTGANARIAGNVDWVQKTVTIPTGTNTVSWVYSKDDSVVSGSDAAWIDQVVFTPALAPEIAVEQPVGTDLVDGTASIDCGSINVGSSSSPITFTVRNTGTADLTSLALTKDGTHNADYTLGSLGATTLAPGASTTFTVTFSPGAIGSRTAAIHIASNDANENPFDISLTGTGLGPGNLAVTPADGLTSSGMFGGPFTPSSQVYTLSNNGGTSINWTAAKGASWVNLSATSGTLAAGANTTVTVSINSGANSFNVGGYSDTVTFTNTTNTNGNTTRGVSLTVNPLAASVNLSGLAQTYDGSPKSVSVSTTPSGLANSVTYGGSPTPPTNAGTYAVVATVTEPNYAGSASNSLVISKAAQTISFGTLADVLDNAAPFALAASATSGLGVSYASSNTAVATVSGNTVNIVGVGSTTITASQAGDANYNAATSVPQTLTVVRANPLAVITGGPYKLLVGQSLLLDGSASQPSYGETISTYEWDLNNDNTFGDVTGATPSAISIATLTGTWGMVQGLNTIKLKITDSANKTSIVSTTVELVLSLTWDANGTGSGQTNGAGAWLGSNLWWDSSANRTWVAGSNATFGGPNTAGGAVTLASPTSVNAITFNTFTGTYTLGTAGQTLTINSGITNNASTGAVTINSPIALGAAQTWTNNSSGGLLLSSALDNGGNLLTIDVNSGGGNVTMKAGVISGNGGLTKNGAGYLEIGGQYSAVTHTYTGTTTLNGGTMRVNNDTPVTGLGNLGSGNLTLNGGVLEYYYGGTFTRTLGSGVGEVQILGGASGFGCGNSVTFTLNNSSYEAVWNSTYFNPSTLVLNAATSSGTTTFANKLDLNGATRTIQVTAGTATLTGVIRTGTGTAGLIKTGAGTLILSADNTYNGTTTINAGTLTIKGGVPGGGSILASSGITMSAGTTLNILPAGANGTYLLSSPIALSGGTGTVSVRMGVNDKKVTLSSVTGQAGTVQTLALSAGYTGNTTDRGNLLFTGAIADGVGGTLGLAVSMAPQTTTNPTFVNLSGQNTFTGPITVTTTGTAAGNSYLTIGGESYRTLGSGSTRSNAVEGSGYLGGGNYTNTISLGTNTVLDYLSSANQILGGAISGGGALLKEGSGTLTLSGANTYTGTTTITAGKLALGASNVLPDASAVSIANATLDVATYSDTVGTLNVTSTATINLGSGAAVAFADSSGVTWTGSSLTLTGNFVSGASVRFGTSNTSLTSAQLAKISAPGLGTLSLNASGYLTSGPGPVASFVISAIGSTQTVGTQITGITLTAKDASNNTSTGFTGTVSFGGTGGFTGTSANFVDGVLSGVSVTPTVVGSGLTFTVDDGSGHTGSATIATIQTQYAAWAGTASFGGDTNGDGVQDGLAWVLGASGPNASATALLPTFSIGAGNMVFTFRRSQASINANTAVSIEVGTTLGTWPFSYTVGADTAGSSSGVTVDKDTPAAGTDTITLSVPQLPDPKKFSRLRVTQAP